MTGNVTPLVPIGRIVGMLTERCESLVRELLPLGRREGSEWREARRNRGGIGDSLSVHIGHGPRRGIWAVHNGSPSEKGDLLDLIAFLRFAGDKKAAIVWAKAWLGIDGADAAALAQLPAPVRPTQDEIDEDAEKRRRTAQMLYLASAPIADSPAQGYLLGRGLNITRLPYPLRALRCHPGLWEKHSQRPWPAMMAAITSSDGKFLAVHRTYLEVLQDGSVRKAPVFSADGKNVAKSTLGSFRGGTIRLWRGTRVDPKTGEVKQARRLSELKARVWVDLVEGIEDGLNVALADTEARVLCAVSVGNFVNVRLPDCVEGVVLWRDNDTPGSKADLAADRAVAHFKAMGKRVAEARPPPGIKDVNEWFQTTIAQRAGERLAL
jgi:hypothetical protein